MELQKHIFEIKRLTKELKCMGTYGLIELDLAEIEKKFKALQEVKNNGVSGCVMHRFHDNTEIWKWWKEQKFQKEQGEQEYTMIYEIDLPEILKAFTEHLLNGA